MAAIEKTNVGLGTALAAAFDFNAAKPLDSRLTVPAYDGLAALSDAGAAYPGMRVYVETGDKQGNYQYINSGWVSETAEIKALIDSVATAAMEFKGAISNGTLPTEGTKGDMYKITTTNVTISAELNAEEAKEVVAKPGDTIVRNGDGKWFYVPSGDDMDDTWRPIKAGGNTLSDTETLEFIAGDHVTITEEAGKVTIAAEDTHYESKIVVGDGATDVTDAATEAGQVHFNLVENGEVKSSHKIVGTGAVTVTHTPGEEGAPGTITINAQEGAKYDLASNKSAANGNVEITLSGTDESVDTLKVKGTGATSVTTDSDGNIEINTPSVDISGKADKVANATEGNFAALDADGNLVDSGKKLADFATKEQGAAADTAVQTISTPEKTIGDVTYANGLKATKTGTNVAIEFDDEVVFILDCN